MTSFALTKPRWTTGGVSAFTNLAGPERVHQLAEPSSGFSRKLAEVVGEYLTPVVRRVDEEAYYPREFFAALGDAGLLKQQGTAEEPILLNGLRLIEETSQSCMTTGFALWCHLASMIYIRNSNNVFLKENVLPKLERSKVRGGTGLSNPLKQLDGLEKLCLKAKAAPGGYVVSGQIPFVSNVGTDAWFAFVACTEDGRKIMAMTPGDAENLALRERRDFLGLNGCATCTCTFNEVFIPQDWLLSQDAETFVRRVRSHFLLYQVPLGLGVSQASVRRIERSVHKQSGSNRYLPMQAEDIVCELQALRSRTQQIAAESDLASQWFELLRVRRDMTHLTSQAVHTAMIHHGGGGYLRRSDSARRLRESYFLINLTPTLRHIEKMLATHA